MILSLVITDRMIEDQVWYDITYQKGLMYWRTNRVQGLAWDRDESSLIATVLGEKLYTVKIEFPQPGRVVSFCTCPSYGEYGQGCKHIVAVLKAAQYELARKKDKIVERKNAAKEILYFFESLQEEKNKEEIRLEVTYQLENSYRHFLSSLELKIGQDKLYVVRNIKDFLDKLEDNLSIEFGKNFTFCPDRQTFNREDQTLLEFLQGIYEQERFLEDSFTYHSYGQGRTSFKGKKVYLSEIMLKRFFTLYQDKTFAACILDTPISQVSILHEDLPLEFILQQEKDQLLLQLNKEDTFLPLTSDGEYFFRGKNIYQLSRQQRKYFTPFYNNLLKGRHESLTFSKADKERFVSEVLPYIKNIAKVSLDSNLEKNLCQEDLRTEIYLDKNEIQDVTAKIEFHYGEEKINPFEGKRPVLPGEKILVRDIEKEKRIHHLLEKAQFKVAQGQVILHEEEKIFQFISKILPILQEEADIYYSDAFKKIEIKDPGAFSGGIRLNEKSNLLEFSFHYPNLGPEELSDVFASLKEKKKYYRLKDGSFLPLKVTELENMRDLLDNLDISEKDLKKKVILLPKYRALYLDNLLRENSLPHLERNLAFKQMVQNIKEPEDMEFTIPPSLKSILRDYQKVGFKWLKTLSTYGLGGILADDMGLGKTLQVITFILTEKEKEPSPSLVIAPTSLVYNWQEEVKKFAPELKAVVISGSQKERQEQLQQISQADLVITSYPLIRRDIEFYQDFDFSYCFLDEAQQIKNPQTVNAKAVKQIKAKGYFALTGTPMENSLTELWSIFDFLMPGYLLSHNKFQKKYEKPIVKDQNQQALKELSKQIKPFILRRMKKDVLKELPQKIETKVTIEMTEEQKKVYLAYLQKAKGEIAQEIAQQGFEKSQIKILAILTRLRQICCHPSLFLENYQGKSGKVVALKEILEESLENGHRILLFSQFTSMLEIIKQQLNKQEINYFYLDGATKAEDRGSMVRSFNQGQGQIFLISLKAGGTGLNLTGADMVIHFDPWWNPAVEEQATDRAYRIGQNKVVQVMKLITLGTIEEKIYQLQEKKKEMINSVIQPGENFLSRLSRKELEALFEL